ncbi:hypothetical protein D9M70_525510 [compost metagenome]
MADRLEQRPRSVKIDLVALVEISLGLTGNDRREMEDHVGPQTDDFLGGVIGRKIKHECLCNWRQPLRHGRLDHIHQRQPRNIVAKHAFL